MFMMVETNLTKKLTSFCLILFFSLIGTACSSMNSTQRTENAKKIEPIHSIDQVINANASSNEKNNTLDSEAQVNQSLDFIAKAANDPHLMASENQIAGTARIAEGTPESHSAYFLSGAEHLNLKNYYFDFPVVYNESVKSWMNYFLSKGKKYFIKYVERSGKYAPLMGRILEDHGLPRDLIFLAMAESGMQSHAKSWARAIGPWQFMYHTGRRYGLKIDWYVDERRDPIKSTIAAAKYLQDLYKIFGSWELAAAGYNAGEGKIARAIASYKTKNFWELRTRKYLKSETKNYVPKIMALAIIGKNLETFGFKDLDYHDPLDFVEVEVGSSTDLYKVASATGLDFETIHKLNPELLRWETPSKDNYFLRMPASIEKTWEACCSEKDLIASDYQSYHLKNAGNLNSVATKFKIPVKVLAELNQLPETEKLKAGDEILLPLRSNHTNKHFLYADLHEKPRKTVRKWRTYMGRIDRGAKNGTKIKNPQNFYTVRKGDTLWQVSKKTGVALDTIIKSNIQIVKNRMIRAGDRLVID
jgi:membrane-bound lytic murein transglycosylase D